MHTFEVGGLIMMCKDLEERLCSITADRKKKPPEFSQLGSCNLVILRLFHAETSRK